MSTYVALNSVMIFARQKTTGTQLATNRLEYLKSLPYDSLAVVGGAIYHPTPLPSTETITLDETNYVINTSINYADDAFDGCTNYATPADKANLCKNLPEPSGATTDTNPADYKIVNVKVFVNSKKVSELDTNISARVAETDSTTGALTVKTIDSAGNPVSGATVTVTNTAITPNINLSDSTDTNGTAIFYGLPPHTGNSYSVTASKSDFSTLSTIPPSGSLSPYYVSQNIIVQQSSSVTLIVNPMGQYSLVGEVFTTSGTPIANAKLYAKGGTKKYNDDTNTEYYFDNLIPTDTRPTSDTSGNFTIQNMDPGNYIFCGDLGATSCDVGGTTYYLIASIPYTEENQIGPIKIPSYVAASPPTTTFPFGGFNYYQKARFILSTDSGFPRIYKLTDTSASKTNGTHTFSVNGTGLNGANIVVKNSGGDMTANCTGNNTDLTCEIDLSSANTEQSNITLTVGGYTLDIPNGTGLLGGINVTP